MKIAVVTGASYGLGKSIAEKLLVNKYKVYGISRTEGSIRDDNFVPIKADLLKDESFDLIKSSITEDKIDLLVNNAGTVILEEALGFTNENFDKTFALNFKSPIKLTAALLPKLLNGLVINISSDSDRFADNLYGLYCASKAALNIFFDSVGLENPSLKIFNILPSNINTPLQHRLNDGKDFAWDEAMEPQKVAGAVIHMVKSEKKFVSGVRVIVISDKLKEDLEDPEKLWFYNVDTKKLVKLK